MNHAEISVKENFMFREMHRIKQNLTEAETIEILQSCTSGVLAVSGDDEYPYAVPLSYAYQAGKLFFHFAKEGHKLDGIIRNSKVSFCVIKTGDVIQKTSTTYFRSAIVFGRARILTEDSEKQYALECLVEKYKPNDILEGQSKIVRNWNNVCVAEVLIEHMTGKTAIEIIHQKS